MYEEGVVRRVIAPGRIEIAFRDAGACSHCPSCRVAKRRGTIEAVDETGARENDPVEVDVPGAFYLLTVFVIYIVPVLFLAAGYAAGSSLAERFLPGHVDAAGVVCAFVSFFLSFGIVRGFDRMARRMGGTAARVTRILPSRSCATETDNG